MRRVVLIGVICLVVLSVCEPLFGKETRWWRKWNNFPNVPRITVEEVQELMMQGQPMAFVYAGYQTDQVLCGSVIVPYTWVPPHSDGSRVRLRIPKDWWVMVY
jgi:hypothetical protein